MRGPELKSTDLKAIAELLKKTRSPYVGERARAEQDFHALGPDGIDALMQLIESKNRGWKRRRKAYFTLVGVYCTVAVPALIYCISAAISASAGGDGKTASALLGGGLGGILGGGGGGILGGFAWLLAPPTEMILAARLLAQIDDLRGIGPLTRVLDMWTVDHELRHAAGKALARMLPRIDGKAAVMIPAEDRARLAKYVLRSRPEKEEELVVAILGALSWVGDTDTLRALRAFQQRLARDVRGRRVGTPMDGMFIAGEFLPGVHEAVSTALLRLEERVAAASGSETLLRPSASGESASSLLRASYGAGSEDQAVLLRSGDRPDAN
jgi:hypothetical protein